MPLGEKNRIISRKAEGRTLIHRTLPASEGGPIIIIIIIIITIITIIMITI